MPKQNAGNVGQFAQAECFSFFVPKPEQGKISLFHSGFLVPSDPLALTLDLHGLCVCRERMFSRPIQKKSVTAFAGFVIEDVS